MRAITQERFKYLLQFIATQGARPLKGNMRTTCGSILPYEAPNYKSANGPRQAIGTQVGRLSSRQQKSTLTMKRVSPHDKKGFTSRAQTPHLDFHPSIGCARAHVFVIFAFLIQALSALKDQPLGVV